MYCSTHMRLSIQTQFLVTSLNCTNILKHRTSSYIQLEIETDGTSFWADMNRRNEIIFESTFSNCNKLSNSITQISENDFARLKTGNQGRCKLIYTMISQSMDTPERKQGEKAVIT